MPLIKGAKAKTKAGMRTNIRNEIDAGKDPKVAVAIAYSLAKKKKKKGK